MGILDNFNITGVKNIKELPTNRGVQFQKRKPMTVWNHPLTRRTKYKIYGYKIDRSSGIRRPHWLKADFPTGRQITPEMLGLDGIYTIDVIGQVGVIAPSKEQKNSDYSKIPEDPYHEEKDTFIYSKELINNRGYLKQNERRE